MTCGFNQDILKPLKGVDPFALKGNKGKQINFTNVQNTQKQESFVKGVLFPDMIISELLMRNVGTRSQGWDHLGHNPIRRT